MDLGLRDRTALVFGATSGLGLATAEALCEGADVGHGSLALSNGVRPGVWGYLKTLALMIHGDRSLAWDGCRAV